MHVGFYLKSFATVCPNEHVSNMHPSKAVRKGCVPTCVWFSLLLGLCVHVVVLFVTALLSAWDIGGGWDNSCLTRTAIAVWQS